MWPLTLAASAALALVQPASAYLASDGKVVIPGATSYNGLNLVPQMGWDNWNAFACDVSEKLLLETAQKFVDYGLRDLGYNYIVLDDCWSIGRNASGYLVHNPDQFPHGMKYIADQLHSMGLKFGMYSSAGILTCGLYPGSLGYEDKDAAYFAENGVDYLKYDNCNNLGQSGTPKLSFDRYNAMSQALNKTGRPVVYSLCNWGNDNPWDWAQAIANSGRMSGDVYDSFNRPDAACPYDTNPNPWPGYHCSTMNIVNKMSAISSRTRPGYFSDLDMLEIGNGGQDDNEYVAQFSMWAFFSSPLLIGTDVRTLSPANLAIYSNPAVIALNQDPSGTAGARIWRYTCPQLDAYGQCEYQLWTRPLANGDMAVVFLNGANMTMHMNATLAEIFTNQRLSGTSKPLPQLAQTWDVHDLWANRLSDAAAGAILNGTAGTNMTDSAARYNATRTSYADGLMANATALMGRKVGTVAPSGTLTADVARHSVGLFRLRAQPTASMMKREL